MTMEMRPDYCSECVIVSAYQYTADVAIQNTPPVHYRQIRVRLTYYTITRSASGLRARPTSKANALGPLCLV